MQPIVKTTELEKRQLPYGLTPRQLEVVNFIYEFKQSYGISPTYREIGIFLGVTKITILGFILQLEEKGWISREYQTARSIELLYDPPCPKIYRNLKVSGKVEKRKIFEKEDTTPQICRDIPSSKLFIVSDESLQEYGIHSGNILLVKDTLPKNESLVLILINSSSQIIKYKKVIGHKIQGVVVGCISTL